jgi:internalin A
LAEYLGVGFVVLDGGEMYWDDCFPKDRALLEVLLDAFGGSFLAECRRILVKYPYLEAQINYPNCTVMSEMALRLIAQAKRERWKRLDLGNCGIVGAVPEEVGELEDLQELILSEEWWIRKANKLHSVASKNRGKINLIFSLPSSLPCKLTSLFASNNPIADLTPLTSLGSLQSLSLSGTRVSNLEPLKRLSRLQVLWLNKTDVADLSPLSGLTSINILYFSSTKVDDLSPLAASIELRELAFNDTKVTDIAPLAGNKGLEYLYMHKTDVADLSPLAALSELNLLHLGNTAVSNLLPLANLKSLAALWLDETKVIDLSPIAQLKSLKWLSIAGTRVADLETIKPLIENSLRLEIEDCPLINPPIEIANQGNKAILNYWKEQESQGPVPLFEAKILLVGEGGAGKTSLLRRMFFPKQNLPQGGDTTRGIEIHQHNFKIEDSLNKWQPSQIESPQGFLQRLKKSFSGKKDEASPLPKPNQMRLNVWDFGGQQIYHSTHQFFLTKRSVYVLVDETRKDETKREDEGFKYWLEMIELKGGDSPVLFFQNQKGGRTKALEKSGIQKRFGNVRAFFEGNLLEAHSADAIRRAVEEVAVRLPHVGQNWPKKWYAIRQQLELEGMRHPYISVARYQEIYREHLALDAAKALELSQYLHDLGVLLHFQDDPILKHILILQNKWATEAVFKVLDNEKVKSANGYFTEAACAEIWKDSIYQGCHAELRQLMVKFELCYPLRDTPSPTWLLPQLLAADRPALPFEPRAGDIVVEYRYVQSMPRGLVNRLMVRMNRYVPDPRKAWRSGVLFEEGSTKVLVEAPFDVKSIVFRARGPASKDLLAALSRDLEALNGTFDGLEGKVEKLVPCICAVCAGSDSPYGFEYGRLMAMKYEVASTAKVQCARVPGEMVRVDRLLDGFESAQNPDGKPGVYRARGLGKRVFISYHATDEAFRVELEKHLRVQERLGNLVVWHMRKVTPGTEWDLAIQTELSEADVVVLLLSPDYFASDSIWKQELKVALERRAAGLCDLAGVVVRECDWRSTALGGIEMVLEAAVGRADDDLAWRVVVSRVLELINDGGFYE